MFIGYKLFPSKVSVIATQEMESIADFYGPDMLHRENFESEVEVWMEMTLLDALQIADIAY